MLCWSRLFSMQARPLLTVSGSGLRLYLECYSMVPSKKGLTIPALTLHLIVTGASWGGFSTASYLSAGGDFPGKIVVQYLAYFLGAEHALIFLHHLWACHARQQGLTAYAHLLSDNA